LIGFDVTAENAATIRPHLESRPFWRAQVAQWLGILPAEFASWAAAYLEREFGRTRTR